METANTNTKKPKISTLDDLFGLPPTPAEGSGEQIQEIALSQLHEFADHPFHVTDDQSLRDMAESIRTYGQLTPAFGAAFGGQARRIRACVRQPPPPGLRHGGAYAHEGHRQGNDAG